jgi:hypothetical protein
MTRKTTPELPAETLSQVIAQGNLLGSLVAIRDRLAAELDDVKWALHKRECKCLCGMSDIRAYVAGTKRLEETLVRIAALPEADGVTKLDQIASAVADLGAHRRSRTTRRAEATGS